MKNVRVQGVQGVSRVWESKDSRDLVSFHLLTILAGQSHIRNVVVLSQVSKSSTLILILAKYFIWKIWGAPQQHNHSLHEIQGDWESRNMGVWESGSPQPWIVTLPWCDPGEWGYPLKSESSNHGWMVVCIQECTILTKFERAEKLAPLELAKKVILS